MRVSFLSLASMPTASSQRAQGRLLGGSKTCRGHAPWEKFAAEKAFRLQTVEPVEVMAWAGLKAQHPRSEWAVARRPE
ncbi:MAG TPA: hypothetical protein VFY22_01495, partial [Hydrogenophaga sp.]|nr:hypothetical protein [Hydrogenophaga sp.]